MLRSYLLDSVHLASLPLNDQQDITSAHLVNQVTRAYTPLNLRKPRFALAHPTSNPFSQSESQSADY